jgi:prevent-host-death family protein
VKRVGLFEAKTHLSKLVEQASRGESFEITRHGRTVARLVPGEDQTSTMTPGQAVERIRAIQSRSTLGKDLTIRQLIDEGRRH